MSGLGALFGIAVLIAFVSKVIYGLGEAEAKANLIREIDSLSLEPVPQELPDKELAEGAGFVFLHEMFVDQPPQES